MADGRPAGQAIIDRRRLAKLIERETDRYATGHAASLRAFERAGEHLLGGVPMTWMRMWPGGFPLYLATAHGARLTDLDGNIFTDFCLGDTGAMAGHSPAQVQAALAQRYSELGGATTMLPTEDAAWVAAELARRFGPSHWSFTLSATDANRWALRIVRQITGRPKILVYSYCYHGSVDESFIIATPAGPRSRPGNTGAPVDPTATSSVVEFNDIASLERELATGDIAAVLMEPALTNIGIVLPEPGYLTAVRELTRAHGTLLINDETHTFSAGPGGWTPTSSPSVSRSAAGSRAVPTASPLRLPSRSSPTRPRTSWTQVAWAALWPAMRCQSPRCARPWSTC